MDYKKGVLNCGTEVDGDGVEDLFMLVPDVPSKGRKRASADSYTAERIERARALSDDAYRDALRYGYEIIQFEHNYVRFGAALVDYAGRDVIPHCDFIYNDIMGNAPRRCSMAWRDVSYKPDYWHYENDIFDEFLRMKKLEKRDRKQEFGGRLDELQFLNVEFRSRGEFGRMLDFVGRHAYMSPYNGVLVFMQKPDSTFVFTGDKWRNDYDRQPKADARKIVTFPFSGRLQCVFDLADTEPIKGMERSLFNFDYELEDEWDGIVRDVRRTDVSAEFGNLSKNLITNGILLDWTLKCPDMCAGILENYRNGKLKVRGYEPVEYSFNFNSVLRFLVNSRYSEEEAFYFICHELARRLCSGDFYNYDIRNGREMSVKEIQFETETVEWLVFRRLGIFNPQEDYLDRYCSEGIVPVCSLERVMKAVVELERMLKGIEPPTMCLLGRVNREYRTAAQEALHNARLQKK